MSLNNAIKQYSKNKIMHFESLDLQIFFFPSGTHGMPFSHPNSSQRLMGHILLF
jgi:hypothetical protein